MSNQERRTAARRSPSRAPRVRSRSVLERNVGIDDADGRSPTRRGAVAPRASRAFELDVFLLFSGDVSTHPRHARARVAVDVARVRLQQRPELVLRAVARRQRHQVRRGRSRARARRRRVTGARRARHRHPLPPVHRVQGVHHQVRRGDAGGEGRHEDADGVRVQRRTRAQVRGG